MKKLAALIIVLALGVGFTATTGITVKSFTDKLFGVTGTPVSYQQLPFNEQDDLITAGAKSADYIFDEMDKAQKTIESTLREYQDTVRDAMKIAGGK